VGVEFVAGNTAARLVRICKDDKLDGSAPAIIDLTGMTAKLRIAVNNAAAVEKTMTIPSPATQGQVEYPFLAGELVAGTMKTEIDLIDGAGKIITQLAPETIAVRAKL